MFILTKVKINFNKKQLFTNYFNTLLSNNINYFIYFCIKYKYIYIFRKEKIKANSIIGETAILREHRSKYKDMTLEEESYQIYLLLKNLGIRIERMKSQLR